LAFVLCRFIEIRMTPRIARTVADLRHAVAAWRKAGERVGLVPTMGALHEGHLTLVRAARATCRRTILSIFVNPTQFGPNADFDRYPRDLEGDVAKLGTVGVDLVFAPDVAEMYPQGFATTVTVAGLTDGLCGPFRPGHFAGVATVVSKLLNQAGPDAAFFGEKDFQQLQVVRRLARDLDIPAEIVGVPTVREADGLAMSSRNVYLSAAERAQAATIYRVLAAAARDIKAGAASAEIIVRSKAELQKAGFAPIDYIEVVDADTLKPIPRTNGNARIAVAAWLGETRLIDNIAA
jgi:pantoate--beta-alanine ligase